MGPYHFLRFMESEKSVIGTSTSMWKSVLIVYQSKHVTESMFFPITEFLKNQNSLQQLPGSRNLLRFPKYWMVWERRFLAAVDTKRSLLFRRGINKGYQAEDGKSI